MSHDDRGFFWRHRFDILTTLFNIDCLPCLFFQRHLKKPCWDIRFIRTKAEGNLSGNTLKVTVTKQRKNP